MKRKELIQLAREAGLDIPDDDPPYNLEFNLEELGVFANLVAEKQQSWIDSLEQHAKDADRLYAELETELAAAQADNKRLRKALEMMMLPMPHKDETPLSICRAISARALEALAQPADASALREMLAQERDRCAEMRNHEDVLAPVGQSAWGEAYQEGWSAGVKEFYDAIRAMEDES